MFSKRIAFSYLEDIAQEFHNNYGRKVNSVTRPYAFIEFDIYIQKAKKSLTDRRRNINTINTQLQDVQRIMVSSSEPSIGRVFQLKPNFTPGSKHWRRAAAGHGPLRAGHQDAEPVDAVAEIQKGRHLSEPEVAVREGRGGRHRHHSVYPLLLGHLMGVKGETRLFFPVFVVFLCNVNKIN